MSDKKEATSLPPAQEARKALAAHKLLGVQAGWLSATAARWMREATGAIPPGYHPMGSTPIGKILRTRAGNVGVVLFPEGPAPGKGPSPAQEEAVLAAGRALGGKVDLLLGISPWGYVGERNFLPKARGVFSCLLGGGEGVGFGFSLEEPEVLWVRPDSLGRAVNVIEFLRLPIPSKAVLWKEDSTFRARLEYLGDNYPVDPHMLTIVGKPPK